MNRADLFARRGGAPPEPGGIERSGGGQNVPPGHPSPLDDDGAITPPATADNVIIGGHPDAVAAAQAALATPPADAPDDPAGDQAPADGTRLVRWIGEPERRIPRRNRRTGEIVQAIDWEYEQTREAPYPGASIRHVGARDFPGLSRSYQFGPGAPFVAEMTAADAQILLDSATGHKFRDVSADLADANVPVRRLAEPLDKKAMKMLRRSGLL